MEIRILNNKNIDIIEKEWKSLENGHDMTFYQTFEWNRNLLFQYNHQLIRKRYKKLRYVCLYDNNKLKLIAPIRIKCLIKHFRIIKEIELFGADSFSDYTNLIYGDITDECFEVVLSYIKNKWKNYKLLWNSIPEKSDFACFMKEKYPEATSDYYKCVYIPILNNYDYFNSLSKSTRQNYRTAKNRMSRDELTFQWRVLGKITDEKIINTLMKVNLTRTVEKNSERFKNKINQIKECLALKYGNILRNMMMNTEHAWTLIVYLNGKEAGFLTGVLYKGTVHVMMNKVHPKYTFYSPMIVSSIEYIKKLSEEESGINIVDFGRGMESYKYKLGGIENNLIKIDLD